MTFFSIQKRKISNVQNAKESLSILETQKYYNLLSPIYNKFTKSQVICVSIFIIMIICFIYVPVPPALIAIGGAVVLIIILRMNDKTLKKVGFNTLVFFASLFVLGAAFESTILFSGISYYINEMEEK